MVREREPPRPLDSQKSATHSLQERTAAPQFGTASPLRNSLATRASPRKAATSPLKGLGQEVDVPSKPLTPTPASVSNVARPVNPPYKMPRSSDGSTSLKLDSSPSVIEIPKPRNPIFNVPRAGVKRTEHHGALPSTSNAANTTRPLPNAAFRMPSIDSRPPVSVNSPEVVEIARPANFASRTIHAAPRPIFSSNAAPNLLPKKSVMPVVDLTRRAADDDDQFDPNKALENPKFGDFDPANYMDAALAGNNIKALLEGAFEDDEDKPKTRLRRKKQQDAAAAELADQLSGLKIEGKAEEEEEEDEADDGTVDGLNVKLLPHQIDGVSWMLDKEIGERKKNGVLPRGGILADDMGLGKTIQALSLILSNPRPSKEEVAADKKLKKAIPESAGKGTLVVAPLALIKQWEAEIKSKVDRSPPLRVLVHHGPSRTKSAEALRKYDVVITTYQTLTSEAGDSSDSENGLKVGCIGVYWYRVILDEAHSIKNRSAKMTKAAYRLDSVYRWCLTGTPMQNNLDELQSLICFLRIKPYCVMANWKEQIGGPMKNGRGGLAMKRLQYFLKAFMKRRTKEILKKEGGLNFGKAGTQKDGEGANGGFKIVARNVETIVAEFDVYERELYDKLAARTEKSLENLMGASKTDYIGALVLLLRLRQTCNHPELIKGNLKKDKDAMPANSSQTPRKTSTTSSTDLDDVADMFGALTVETKKCDACQTKLNKEEVESGAIRCSECEADFSQFEERRRPTKVHKKSKVRKEVKEEPRRRKHTKRIVDSDDEEEGGEWIVPKSKREQEDLGKAGGSDDEDAEGGGRDLGFSDSDTGDETELSQYDKLKSRKKNQSSFIDDDDDDETSENSTTNSCDSESKHDASNPFASTKIRRLLTILKRETPGHKVIVFSEFTSMLNLIEPFLARNSIRFTRYDGSMRNDEREASLARLRNDTHCRVLLCSLKCGALGLNLTAASRVILMEPFWNPFVEEQAIDRVHRLNQTQDVTVYRLTIRDSVEERIIELQEKKRELAKVAIEGGSREGVGKLSLKDILSLFKRDAEYQGGHEDARTLALANGRAGLLEPKGGSGSGSGRGTVVPARREETRKTSTGRSSQFDESFGRRW